MDDVSISPEICLNWNCRRRYDTELAAYSIERPYRALNSLEYWLSSANGAVYLLLMALAVVSIDSDAKRKNFLVTIRFERWSKRELDRQNSQKWIAFLYGNVLPIEAVIENVSTIIFLPRMAVPRDSMRWVWKLES